MLPLYTSLIQPIVGTLHLQKRKSDVKKEQYLSNKDEIFRRDASHGTPVSSLKESTSDSSFLKYLNSIAASRNESAFLSGQLKCFSTALSSDCNVGIYM
jgi:hypothetical protein